jgi:hypothetical protein
MEVVNLFLLILILNHHNLWDCAGENLVTDKNEIRQSHDKSLQYSLNRLKECMKNQLADMQDE